MRISWIIPTAVTWVASVLFIVAMAVSAATFDGPVRPVAMAEGVRADETMTAARIGATPAIACKNGLVGLCAIEGGSQVGQSI